MKRIININEMKIQARELMIGNIVYCADCAGELMERTVTEISHYNVSTAFCDGWVVSEPIPLTEERWIKFGFERVGPVDDSWLEKKHKEFKCTVQTFHGGYILSIDKHPFRASVFCSTVHKLQNVYFALTGEELKIKDPLNRH